MSNAMMIIHPYRDHGDWVFDDEATGLKREPFVFGMPEMIDIFVKDIPNAERGFKLYFSAKPFPGHAAELDWLREEYEGNWYRWKETGQEGWLCPALFKYFAKAPEKSTARPSRPNSDPAFREAISLTPSNCDDAPDKTRGCAAK